MKLSRLLETAQFYSSQEALSLLSDAELFSIVIKDGMSQRKYDMLMKRLREHLELDGLDALNSYIDEILEIDGKKAIQIKAVLEIANRLLKPPSERIQIKSPTDAVKAVKAEMMGLDHEELFVLLLDSKNHIRGKVRYSKGTVNSSVMRAAEILRPAVVRNYPNIILVHNHPSGDATPSAEDIEVTKQCVAAATLLDIHLLDHLIIGNPGYTSLKERLGW